MDTDIRDAIERSFGDGPAHAGTEDLLAHGRRALRRRRLTEAGSMLAVAVVAVVATSLATGGRTHETAPQPAAPAGTASAPETRAIDPTSRATPRPEFPPPAGAPLVRDKGLPMNWAVAARPDGLHVSPKVKILKVVDDPWDYRPEGAWSVAISYRDGKGVVTWWAGYTGKEGSGSSASIPSQYAGMGFDAWVATQNDGLDYAQGKDLNPSTPAGGWPGRARLDLVRFAGADAERLTPLDAVTLLDQRAHPDLPDSWARPADRSAVAEVRFEGIRYYVLARSTAAGDPQYVAVKAAKGGATLDDFLDLARQRYAEGGGGLL